MMKEKDDGHDERERWREREPRSHTFQILDLWLRHAGDLVEIPMTKLLVMASPLEIGLAKDIAIRYGYIEALADMILDGLESVMDDEEWLMVDEKGPKLSEDEVRALREEYQKLRGFGSTCGSGYMTTKISATGGVSRITVTAGTSLIEIKDGEIISDPGPMKRELEAFPETLEIVKEMASNNIYFSMYCNARHMLRSVRKIAFKAGVVDLREPLICDKRTWRSEEMDKDVERFSRIRSRE